MMASDANRKQAVIPAGATVLEPRGTAPGLVVPPAAVIAGSEPGASTLSTLLTGSLKAYAYRFDCRPENPGGAL